MQRWIRSLKSSHCLVLALLVGGGSTALAGTGFSQLDLGIARFALDTGDYAAALVHTPDPRTEQESLIRARALIGAGNTDEAITLLDHLVDGDHYRGEAALLKSSVADLDQASRQKLLELAAGKGKGGIRQRALYELADIARNDGRPDQAGQILATMAPGYWAALGYMNIAADYGRHDLNPSRALIALRVAMAMSGEDPDSIRGQGLKDQLLVRAGLLSYQSGDYDKAITFLEKVSVDGYSTPQGLYLHGLALSAKGNQRDAMQSWHRAKKYPLAFPGVSESWLGTGRGYDLAGYLGQAGEAYLSASASYESERVILRQLAELIREKGAFEALFADADTVKTEWFLEDSRMLTQPRSAYLLRFMENVESQNAVQRVRELKTSLTRMNRQQHTLKVFQGVLEERLNSPDTQSPAVINKFDIQFDALVRRVSKARENVIPGSDNADQISELVITLSDLRESSDRFGGRLAKRDRRLKELSAKVGRSLTRLGQSREKAEMLMEKANERLDRQLLAYVETETRRTIVALEKAEQQIAHLYEYLALQSLERKTP